MSARKEGKGDWSVIFRRLENLAADVPAVRRLRRKPEHPVAARLPQRRKESLAPGVRALDHDHPVLAEPPFLFATGGIEVVVVGPELAEDLRFAVPVVAQLRALDLQEVAERLAGVRRIGDVEDRVRVDRVFEVRLLPRVAEPLARREPVEPDMERRYLQLMVERPEGMLVEGLGRRSGISIPQGVGDTLRGEAVGIPGPAP